MKNLKEQRTETERSFLEQKHSLEALFKNSPEAIVHFDHKHCIVNINPRFTALFGYTLEEIKGKNINDVLLDSEKLAESQRFYKDFLVGKENVADTYRMDKWGNPVAVITKGTPIITDEGIIGGYASYQDIRHMKEAERKLRENEALKASIIEAMPDLLLRFDRQGRYLSMMAGDAEKLNESRNNMIGKTMDQVLPKDNAIQGMVALEKAFQTGEMQVIEYELRTLAGTRHFESRIKSYNEREAVAIVRDITERVNMMEDLVKAKEIAETASMAKTEFLANMSHEIRTPMNGMAGFLQLLALTELTEEQREYLDYINTASETLLNVINDILDISKIEAGRMELREVPSNLLETVEAAVLPYQAHALGKGIELVLEMDEKNHWNMVCDGQRLRQILTNLVSNAIKFTDEGKVLVRVELLDVDGDKSRVHFQVQDTGIGISESLLEVLARPFVQGDSSANKKYGGTGLGLAIVRRFVEMMKGTLFIESEEKMGTTVSFTLSFKTVD